jgi:hypothetical protein
MDYKSRLVCKVEKDTINVVINGEFKSVSRKIPGADLIINLCSEYNSTKDENERESILSKIEEMTNPASKIELESDGRFVFDGKSKMYLKGTEEAIPEFLAKKLLAYIENGAPVTGLVNFWKHLLLNPDSRVRGQLYEFLENGGHPITDMGYFLAYKSVAVKRKYDTETGEEIQTWSYNEDTGEKEEPTYNQDMVFQPHHMGPFGTTIKFGEPVTMPRDECDDDPYKTCSSGLHVGSMEYVGDFGGHNSVILEVLVSPRNVVAVPLDYNATKMRCCEYYPISISNGENQNIYLESDYTEFDRDNMDKDLEEYLDTKKKHIENIEREIEQKLLVRKSITI